MWWGTTVKSEDLCISALSVVLCKLFCEKSVIYLRMLGATTKIMRRSDVIHPRCTDAGLRNSTVPTERVANIVRSAQALLQPLAAIELDVFDEYHMCAGCQCPWSSKRLRVFRFKKLARKYGMLDGIGCLLKLADFHLERDGSISAHEMKRFESQGASLISELQASALNYSVLLALFLTIFSSLLVLHAGSSPYFTEDASLRLGGAGDLASGGSTRPWFDAAAVLSPDDAEQIRRAFYVCEVVSLALGSLATFWGLMPSVVFYVSLSTALPTIPAKCEYLLSRLPHLTTLISSFSIGCICLSIAIPFVVARSSFIAFVCCAVVAVLMVGSFCHHGNGKDGDFWALFRAQQREARMILHSRDELASAVGADP